VGLDRGPLSVVSTIEELLERKSSSGLEYARGDTSRWPRGTLYPQKLALTSPTSGGRSVGIVRSRIQATEFVCLLLTKIISIEQWHNGPKKCLCCRETNCSLWTNGHWMSHKGTKCFIAYSGYFFGRELR
jgi:hypothetical protein